MLFSYKMFQTQVLLTTEYSTKKPDKWKKHSVLKIVLTTFFGRNLVYVWFEICPSYLSRKKGTSGTFLSLGLFISRSRPTASTSKMRPRLQKTFPRFPFFYFGNLDKSQIRSRQIFPQSSQHNFQNKILFLRKRGCKCTHCIHNNTTPGSKSLLLSLTPCKSQYAMRTFCEFTYPSIIG